MKRFLLLLCAGLIVTAAVSAQDDPGTGYTAHGVVTLQDDGGWSSLFDEFPASWCGTEPCQRMAHLLFPTLFSVDPAFNVIRPAQAGERVLIAHPPAIPAAEQQYTLAPGLMWSDGTPITAYDAVYSILIRENDIYYMLRPILGVRIDDEYTFTVSYGRPDCTAQARLNTGILPSAIAAPGFRAFADAFLAENTGIPTISEWYDLALHGEWGWHPVPDSPQRFEVFGGAFVYSDQIAALHSTSGDLVIQAFADPAQDAAVAFTHGDLNLLLDPPLEDRVNLRTIGDALIYEAPGYAVDRLVFNLSDPYYPRSSTVGGVPDGAPLEQLPNPFLSDVRVRRAIRLAIDTQALIDGALYRGGVALGGMVSPASWAFDPSLPAWGYDPIAADRLLNEAGWRGDGVRRCVGCAYSELRQTLSLSLGVDGDPVRQRAAEMIQNQLGRVGIQIQINDVSDRELNQDNDLYLIGSSGNSVWERDPDFTDQLTPAYDVLGLPSSNIGSYANPAMTDLLEQARTVPTCDISARAAIYADVQRLVNDDLPFTALYARNDFYIARGITHFAPLPGEPLWNITDWGVAR